MEAREIRIGNRAVGFGKPPFIMAEVGINHNGEIEKAYEMIRIAKNAGADAVKFQTFKADEFVGDPNQTYTYKSQGKPVTESMLTMFKRYEFDEAAWYKVKKKCDEEGILFLSTPQNRSDLDLLLKLKVPAVKVGSDDFTNIPLLKDYASTGLPLILSTGMADMAEVYQSLTAVGALDGYPVVLLVCTSQYPTPPSDANLKRIETLKAAFPMLSIGFSDHTQGPLASSLAMSLGACLFEKHFTLDNDLPGPDHWFSENPEGLKTWIESVRTSYTMLGDGLVRPSKKEREMRTLARRSVVALREIHSGEDFTSENIGLRRPGNGLPPVLIEKIIGTKATREITKGALIQMGDFQ